MEKHSKRPLRRSRIAEVAEQRLPRNLVDPNAIKFQVEEGLSIDIPVNIRLYLSPPQVRGLLLAETGLLLGFAGYNEVDSRRSRAIAAIPARPLSHRITTR